MPITITTSPRRRRRCVGRGPARRRRTPPSAPPGRAASSSSAAARAADRAVSGRRAPGIATTSGESPSSQASADLGRRWRRGGRRSRELVAASQRAGAARAAERGVGDQRQPELGAARDHPAPQRAVVERAQSDLHRRDRRQLERFVELGAGDVREPDARAPVRRRRAGRARVPTSATASAGRARGSGTGRSAVRRAPRGSPRSRPRSPSRGRPAPTPPPGRVMPPLVTIRALRCRPAARSARATSRSLCPARPVAP